MDDFFIIFRNDRHRVNHDIFAQPLIPKDFLFLFSIMWSNFHLFSQSKLNIFLKLCCSYFLVSKRYFYSQLLSLLLNFSLPRNLMNLHNCKILVFFSTLKAEALLFYAFSILTLCIFAIPKRVDDFFAKKSFSTPMD